MKKYILPILSVLLLSSCHQPSSNPLLSTPIKNPSTPGYQTTKEVILTTGDKTHLLEKQINLIGQDKPLDYGDRITIEEEVIAPIKMFGAALTHASAHQLMLDKTGLQRKEILQDLFSSQGANFNAIRLPIGASDFHAEEHVFTCCDVKGEEDLLEHFTLSHDQEVISVIKEIYEIRPDLKIIAVPWSAPEWMKLNTHESSEDPSGPKLCGGILNDTYLSTFANYLNKFCYAYADLGIKINYLTLQNEPTFNGADYPCMLLSPSQANTLALELNATLPEWTSLLAYDHNCEPNMYSYLEEQFTTETTSLFPSIAIHGYGSQSIPDGVKELRKRYPNKEIYMTEITEWEHNSSFATDLMYVCKNTTIKAFQSGLNGTLYWNLILDSNGGPNIGQKSTCYGVVNIDQKEDGSLLYTKRPSYYGLSSLSHLLALEEEKITYSLKTNSTNPNLLAIGFKKENEYSVVVCNTSYESLPFSVSLKGKYYSIDLDPTSIIGFTLESI